MIIWARNLGSGRFVLSSPRVATQLIYDTLRPSTKTDIYPSPQHVDSPGPTTGGPAMTLRRYAHVLEDMEDEGGRAMDELF